MRNKFLSALLLVAFCTAHAQERAEAPEGKSNIEATPGSAMTQERHQNLPKGFRGDSLSSLIDKLKHFEKSSQDEFTKTSERNAKFDALRVKPYKFVISPEINTILEEDSARNYKNISGTRYDADAEVMKVNLWVKDESLMLDQMSSRPSFSEYTTIVVAESTKNNSYIGQNAYGAKAKISSTLVSQVGLAVANVKQQRNTALFSLSFPIKPREAKAIKDDLAFYVDVELTNSEALKGNILKTSVVSEATITSPSEVIIAGQYVLVNIKEVGVYRKSNGEVLGWKIFEDASSDDVLDTNLDGNGNNALHSAIWNGLTKKALKVIERKIVDLNSVNKFGATALHLAVAKDNLKVVQALIDAGANAEIRGKDGTTPLMDARKIGNRDVIKVLEKAGTK